MGRRRASAPSALVLQPATVPLIRGAPKFVLPSPPSANHLAPHHRLTRTSDATRVAPLKEMPRLPEYIVGMNGFASRALPPPPPHFRSHSLSSIQTIQIDEIILPPVTALPAVGRSSSVSSHGSF